MQIEKGFTDNWLLPTGEQESLMRQYAGCKRFVWNRALSIEQSRYRRGEKTQLGKYAMMRELTIWRNNPDPHSNFLKDAPVHVLQNVLFDLYDSYQRFFKGEQVHPPQFKKKSKGKISFTESDPAAFELDEANKRVRLPKLGWVKCRFTQHIKGKPNSVTVKWNGVRWILSVQCKVEIANPKHPSDTIVAGDFGIVHRVTFSDGVVVPPIDVSREENRKAFYQRQLKNKRKFSQNWKNAVASIRKLDSRITNIRKDATHKFTSEYSKNHAVIVLGDLNIKSMSASAAGTTKKPGKNVKQKSGLNRAILRQGWGELGRQLEYKQLWQGGLVEYQSEAYTSQDCPKCSNRSPLNRKTQDTFECVSPDCGFKANADDVAAHNQLAKFISGDKGVALLASGYRASVNSLWSGQSRDSAAKQEPIEEAAQCA
jgi:putative transposase